MHKYFVWKFRNADFWLYGIVIWFKNKAKVHMRTIGLRARINCILC
jgi:hypothetical protein